MMNKRLYKFLIIENLSFILLFTIGVIFLYIIIDFFENIDKFLKNFNFFKIFLYYFYQTPYLFVLLLPVGALLAPFFTIGRMAKDFELIAIKTSGIHIRNFFLPLIFLGIFLSLISFTVNETIKPVFTRKSESIKYREIEKRPPPWERIFEINFNFLERKKDIERLFHFGRIDSRKKEGQEIYIHEKIGKETKRFIYAKKGKFSEEGWELFNGILYVYKNGEVVNFEKFEKKLFSDMKVSPLKMLSERKSIEEMNMFEILKLTRILKSSGLDSKKEEVEFFVHLSFPFSVLITLLLSMSLASLTRQRGKAFTITLASLLSFIYWGLLEISRAMGYAGILPPFISAWLPNIIFSVPAILFFFFIPA